MKVKALLAIVASLSLAACAVPDEAPRHGGHDHGHSHGHNHDHGHSHGHAHQQQGGINASFNCENGLAVHVRSLSTDSIELRLDDKHAVLKSPVAGSGGRLKNIFQTAFFRFARLSPCPDARDVSLNPPGDLNLGNSRNGSPNRL